MIDHGISRRRFLTIGGAAIATTAVGAAFLKCTKSSPSGTGGTAYTVDLGQYPDLATVGNSSAIILTVDSLPLPLIVTRTGNTTATAISAICTHEGCQLSAPTAGSNITCPCHSAQFTTAGVIIQQPQTGETAGNLQSFPATISGSTLTITI